MKLSFTIATFFMIGGSSITDAFSPSSKVGFGGGINKTPATVTTKTTLYIEKTAARLLEEAKEATAKYGPSSPEAALAWEAVEEIDSRDNSAAYEVNTANMMSDEELARVTAEFQDNIQTVQRFTKDLQYHQQHMNDVAEKMAAIKIMKPENRPAPRSPELDAAMTKAKQMSTEFGPTSNEARLAWETVEEIASSGLENSMGENMTEECMVEAAEHCLALEELDRFMKMEAEAEAGN
jgi:hypothetical protein